MVAEAAFESAAISDSVNASAAFDRITNNKPGLVQNCPTPSVIDAAKAVAVSAVFNANVSGNKTTGLILLISAYNGIGSFLFCVTVVYKAIPAR